MTTFVPADEFDDNDGNGNFQSTWAAMVGSG